MRVYGLVVFWCWYGELCVSLCKLRVLGSPRLQSSGSTSTQIIRSFGNLLLDCHIIAPDLYDITTHVFAQGLQVPFHSPV